MKIYHAKCLVCEGPVLAGGPWLSGQISTIEEGTFTSLCFCYFGHRWLSVKIAEDK